MDMSNGPLPDSVEERRVATLDRLDILDTPPEREFDELTRLAAVALNAQSAAVSLIDEKRQWFKSRVGIPFPETPRDIAFCTHAVASHEMLVVPDATKDSRFAENPLVTAENGIRFYAGAPLIVSTGDCLGTLCVFDSIARPGLTEEQETVLRDLARLAAEVIESRRFRKMGEIAAKVVDATSDAVLAADLQGRIVYWNPAAEQMFGRLRGEVIGQPVEIIIPPRLAIGHKEVFGHAARGGETRLVGSFIELTGARADGSEFPLELSLARWGEQQNDQGFAAIVRDISERKALEREREHAALFLDSVVSNLPAMLFVKDVESREYLMINRAGERIVGRPQSDIVGRRDRDLFPEHGAGYEQRDSEAIASGARHVFESTFTREDGEFIHLRTIRKLIDGPDRPDQYLLGVSEDVTEVRLAEAEVLRLAHYDSLTGLLNRASYTDRLYRMVQEGTPFAMLSIDIDRFKSVNDQFGHPTGDEVLVEIADRLRAALHGSCWVARVGGDEFIVVMVGNRLRERSATLAESIIARISEPVRTRRGVAYVGASVGVVLMPDDGTSTDQLRQNVDIALYRAKQNGKARACYFDAAMDASARDKQRIAVDLRKAVEAGEITLDYQPVLSASTGQITSAEALARWRHPTRGPISPDVFIPLAEESGLVDQLGEQLLRRACLDACEWPSHMRVAVNLSPMQFISENLLGTVRNALDVSGLAARRLQLEVTEGLVIRDVDGTFEQLEQLRQLGIQILIDDFGVGYSSLSYFERFPFDKVKIDKSFVDEIETSRAASAIIQAVVGLGRQLGMAVVAEGVETEQQVKLLIALGCTHLQGYLFSRPLPAASLRELLKAVNGANAVEKSFAA